MQASWMRWGFARFRRFEECGGFPPWRMHDATFRTRFRVLARRRRHCRGGGEAPPPARRWRRCGRVVRARIPRDLPFGGPCPSRAAAPGAPPSVARPRTPLALPRAPPPSAPRDPSARPPAPPSRARRPPSSPRASHAPPRASRAPPPASRIPPRASCLSPRATRPPVPPVPPSGSGAALPLRPAPARVRPLARSSARPPARPPPALNAARSGPRRADPPGQEISTDRDRFEETADILGSGARRVPPRRIRDVRELDFGKGRHAARPVSSVHHVRPQIE